MDPSIITCNDLLSPHILFFKTFQMFLGKGDFIRFHFIRQHALYPSGTNFAEYKDTNKVIHSLHRSS